jgi:hypothetical protein
MTVPQVSDGSRLTAGRRMTGLDKDDGMVLADEFPAPGPSLVDGLFSFLARN